MNFAGILYTVVLTGTDGVRELDFIGDMDLMCSIGFEWGADNALQNMECDRVTQYGVHVEPNYGVTYETRSHWLLPVLNHR